MDGRHNHDLQILTMTTQIYNGKILIPGGRWIDGGSVVIADGRIDDIYAHSRIFENIGKAIDEI